MLQYIAKRLAGLAPTLFIVAVLVFLFVHLLPGDPARGAVGKAGVEHYEAMREKMGLDLPLTEQFWRYTSSLAQGDFGYSYSTRRPVAEDLTGDRGDDNDQGCAGQKPSHAAVPVGRQSQSRRACTWGGSPGAGRVRGRCC